MNNNLVSLLVGLFLAPLAATAAIDDAFEATCRITASDGGRGTGCVFERSRGQVFVLTAAHVVGRDATVQCEFWHAGHQSQPLRAAVIARSTQCDAALLALDESLFGPVLPRAIPLAPRDTVLPAGATIASAGCAAGSWSTAWKGHVLGYQGGDLRFVPAPANGRSGSAVLDADGRMIVGLLRARTVDSGEGIATSVARLHEAFDRESTLERRTVVSLVNAECPGGLCPVSPLRPAPSGTPYPTLPRTPAKPPAAAPELDGLRGELSDLRAALERLRATSGPPGKDGRDGASVDPQVLRQWQDEWTDAKQRMAGVEEIAAGVAAETVAQTIAPWATRSTTALLIGLGVPGGVAGIAAMALVWLGTRGVKRGLKRVETQLSGRLKGAAGEAPFA